MKDTTKKYADEAYDIICHAANVIGSRLPGSKGEREYAKYMGDSSPKSVLHLRLKNSVLLPVQVSADFPMQAGSASL